MTNYAGPKAPFRGSAPIIAFSRGRSINSTGGAARATYPPARCGRHDKIAESRSFASSGPALSPRHLPRLHGNRGAEGYRHMVGSRLIIRERAGDFPRGRNAFKIGSQGDQLANPRNSRHIRDQLVFYRKGRDRRLNRRPGDRDEDRVVLSSRAGLGGYSLGAPQTGLMSGQLKIEK